MSLEELGNIGEFVGSIGVIASLVYLAMQIRQNTRSTRAQTFLSISSEVESFARILAENPDAARIWRIGLGDPDALEPDEFIRFSYLLTLVFQHAENVFIQRSHEMVDGATWATLDENMGRYAKQPGVRRWWAFAHVSFHPDFRRAVERRIREAGYDA
jgi:hypothetical protein